jgi:hypothetical protein
VKVSSERRLKWKDGPKGEWSEGWAPKVGTYWIQKRGNLFGFYAGHSDYREFATLALAKEAAGRHAGECNEG